MRKRDPRPLPRDGKRGPRAKARDLERRKARRAKRAAQGR
jgi:hypothetical protein